MSYASVIKSKSSTTSPKTSEVRSLVHSAHGQVVRLVLRNGAIYEGVLAPFNNDPSEGLSLNYARRIDSTTPLTEPFVHNMNVMFNNLAQFFVQFEKPASHAKKEEKAGFKTDTEISNTDLKGQQRTLQKFAFAPEDGPVMASLDEEISKHKSGTQWDQYALNKKFGVKSTYEERLYTTEINRSDPKFSEKEKIAAKIADEIANQGSSNNIHLSEERGKIVQKDFDEEARFSQVMDASVLKPSSSPTPPSTTASQPKEEPKSSSEPEPKSPVSRSTSEENNDSTSHSRKSSTSSKFALNPNAREFVFNPNAAEFSFDENAASSTAAEESDYSGAPYVDYNYPPQMYPPTYAVPYGYVPAPYRSPYGSNAYARPSRRSAPPFPQRKPSIGSNTSYEEKKQ